MDYSRLDPFKVAAQRLATTTDANISRLGLEVVRESRGESVFLIRAASHNTIPIVGGLTETLGTKNLVADAIRSFTGRSHYDQMAQDTVAMNVNDAITLGVIPIVVGPLITVGSTEWFLDRQRSTDLVDGWKAACDVARCVYGPGETASLSGLVDPASAVLSGFALGVITDESRRIAGNIQKGDAIIFFASSGIHANGLTNARAVARKLPNGYATKLDDGKSYGESLVEPTPIYSAIVEDCLTAGLKLRYCVNVTGHGWLKLMRSPKRLCYVIDEAGTVPVVLRFLQDYLQMSAAEAYRTFNMGAGFAIYVAEEDADAVVSIAKTSGVNAWRAGYVDAPVDDSSRVVVSGLGLEFKAEDLALR